MVRLCFCVAVSYADFMLEFIELLLGEKQKQTHLTDTRTWEVKVTLTWSILSVNRRQGFNQFGQISGPGSVIASAVCNLSNVAR